jgi:UPF0716 family protein affecting phage T7 exclusion
VLRRLPIIICAVVVLDLLFWGMLSYWLGWSYGLVETGLTTIAGLAVIIYYEWRWSDAVTKRIESEPRLLDGWVFEKVLLLIAGIVLLIPGVLTDCLGIAMLMPAVRRMIVTTFDWQS